MDPLVPSRPPQNHVTDEERRLEVTPLRGNRGVYHAVETTRPISGKDFFYICSERPKENSKHSLQKAPSRPLMLAHHGLPRVLITEPHPYDYDSNTKH